MKKTNTTALGFALCISLLAGLPMLATAQNTTNEPGQIRVKVTERTGNDTRVIERTYRSDGLTDEKRDALVNKLIDSLQATRKGKGNQSISVIVDDSYPRPARNLRRNRVVEDGYALAVPPMPPNTPDFDLRFQYSDDNDTTRNGQRTREFRLQRRKIDSLSRAMQRMARDFERDMRPMAQRLERDLRPMAERLERDMRPMAQKLERDLRPMADRLNRAFQNNDWQRDLARPYNAWADGGQTSTVRGLDVYPSNPDRNLLNVRFNAPAKGDVQIIVTNTKGKEVARRDLKDFSGEFVGQVDVGRNATGVFFVTVTQNEDGAVRRVSLGKNETSK